MVSLCDDPVGTNRDTRSSRLSVLFEALLNILGSLSFASACKFPAIVPGTFRKFHFTVASYCCDNLEGKDIYGVKHGGKVF